MTASLVSQFLERHATMRYKRVEMLTTSQTATGRKVAATMTLFVPLQRSMYREYPADQLRKSTPPGYRWITVHPDGNKEGPGVPIMIKESASEPGAFYVVGGAGGKMNHLKLTGVKSKDEYKADQQARRQEKKKQQQDERKQLIDSGQFGAKRAFDEQMEAQHAKKETAHIKDYLKEMLPELGLDPKDYVFNPDPESLKDSQGNQIEPGSAAFKMLEYHAMRRIETAVRQKHKEIKAQMLRDDVERLRAGIDQFALSKERSSADVMVAIATKPKVDEQIRTVKEKLDAARSEGKDEQADELQGLVDELETDSQHYAEIIDQDKPTVDEMAAKRLKGGKGYSNDAKGAAIEAMVANGDLGWEKLAADAGDDHRGDSVRRHITTLAEELDQPTILEDGTVVPPPQVLCQRDMQERAALLKEAATASKTGDYEKAYTSWKKAERLVTKWEQTAQRVSEKESPTNSLLATAVAIVTSKKTMADVSAGAQRGATRMDVGEIERAVADGEKLKRMEAIDKKHAAAKADLKRKGDELKKQAEGAGYQIDSAAIADKFHVSDLQSDDFLKQAERSLLDQRMVEVNSRLLSEVEQSPELMSQLDVTQTQLQRAMEQHISAGAYTALANATLLSTGDTLVDRRIIDSFGVKGASSLLAAHLRDTLDPEHYQTLVDGLEAYHGTEGTERAMKALDVADDAYAAAKRVELEELSDPTDAIQAQYVNDKRRSVLEDALHELGQTIGHLRANAELINALKNVAPRDRLMNQSRAVTLNLGNRDLDAVIQTMASLGVPREEYKVDSGDVDVGKDRPARTYSVGIHYNAIKRMVGSDMSRDEIERAAESQRIKRGLRDEAGWLPDGIARRMVESFTGQAPVAPQFAVQPAFADKADYGAVKDHVAELIGSRVADGVPIDVAAGDLRSASFQAEHVTPHVGGGMDLFGESTGNPDLLAHIDQAIDELVPRFDPGGEWNDEKFSAFKKAREDAGQKLAEQFRASRGLSSDAIHAQRIDTDRDPDSVIESVHRALAANPTAVLAYKDTSELTAPEQNALRKYWWDTVWSPANGGATRDQSLAAKKREEAEKTKGKRADDEAKALNADVFSMFGDDEIDLGTRDERLDKEYGPDDEVELRDQAGQPMLGKDGTPRMVNAREWQAAEKAKYSDAAAGSIYGQGDGGIGARGQELAARNAWEQYSSTFGSNPDRAYRAIQSILQGQFNEQFADHYARLSGQKLKASKVEIPMAAHHVTGLSSRDEYARAREKLDSPLKGEMARVGRQGNQFVSGARKEKALESLRVKAEDQRGLLQDDETERAAGTMRTTLGDTAEGQIRRMVSQVAQNWNPKSDPIALKRPGDRRTSGMLVSMGDDSPAGQQFYKQQRAIKLIGHQKKVGLWLGAGSGKSLTSLGAFTHGHLNGDHARGLFAGPSQVQAQFGGEAIRFLDPTTRRLDGRQGWKWFAKPGASREERHAAYADPKTDFMVLTHEGLRDDTLAAIGEHRAMPMESVADWFNGLGRDERKKVVADAFEHKGWHNLDYLYVDEAHEIVNRAGKANSTMANVMDAIGDNARTHVLGSGTPVKNDASEAFDHLSKLDPDRFYDRGAFMRRYGANTATHTEALQRLGERYFYQERVAPDSVAHHHDDRIALSDSQKQQLKEVHAAFNVLKTERQNARAEKRDPDAQTIIGAIRTLSPGQFHGVPESEHLGIARRLMRAAGPMREAAFNRIINQGDFETNAKMQHVAKLAADYKRQGKPGVVFAHNLSTVDALTEGLRKQGHRVAVLKGTMSGEEKDAARRAFTPDSGDEKDAKADVLVMSDAGNTGLNLQRGKYLVHVDQPYTSPVLEQRTARIHRLGQRDDVHVHQIISDTQFDGNAERRLERKGGTSHIWQDPSHTLDDTGLGFYLNQAMKQRLGVDTGYKVAPIGGDDAAARRAAKKQAKTDAGVAQKEAQRQRTTTRQRQQGTAPTGNVELTHRDTPKSAAKKLVEHYQGRVPVKHWSTLEGTLKESIGKRGNMTDDEWREHLAGVRDDFHAHIHETFPEAR